MWLYVNQLPITMQIPAVILAGSLLLVSGVPASATDDDRNIGRGKTTRTESTTLDEHGDIQKVEIAETTRVNVQHSVTEVRERDATGALRSVSRVTTVDDKDWGQLVIREALVDGYEGLVIVRIEKTVKDADGGSVATVRARSTDGEMRLLSRVTTHRLRSGAAEVIREAANSHGQLVETGRSVTTTDKPEK
jgi:hypothetical protein